MQYDIGNIISAGVAIISYLVGGYFFLRKIAKEQKKQTEEFVEKGIRAAVEDVKEKAMLEKRLSLLEQKIKIYDGEMKGEIREIKEMIEKLYGKLYDHINESD